jgi:hypothetical protein
MPIVNTSSKNLYDYIKNSEAPLIEFLIKTDTSPYLTNLFLDSLEAENCKIWYNPLFSGISGGHNESENAIDAWNWFLNKNAYVIQTDYPFELLTFLIEKNLHSKPLDFQPIPLDKLPSKQKPETKKEDSQKNQTKKPESHTKWYTVKSGDSLSRIASRNKTTLKTILKLNPKLSENSTLRVGQKIRIK